VLSHARRGCRRRCGNRWLPLAGLAGLTPAEPAHPGLCSGVPGHPDLPPRLPAPVLAGEASTGPVTRPRVGPATLLPPTAQESDSNQQGAGGSRPLASTSGTRSLETGTYVGEATSGRRPCGTCQRRACPASTS
jgi:hypothetical protein